MSSKIGSKIRALSARFFVVKITPMSHGFQPGNTHGNGRPKGRPNIRSEEQRLKWEARGYPDIVEFYGPIVVDQEQPLETRMAAMNCASPHLWPKIGAIIPAPELVFVEAKVEYQYPNPQSLDEARANLAHLDQLFRDKEIGLATYNTLKNTQDKFFYTLLDQRKQDTAEGGSPTQTIRIEGGLPLLPGTNVIMPDGVTSPGEPLREMNGHDPSGSPPTTGDP